MERLFFLFLLFPLSLSAQLEKTPPCYDYPDLLDSSYVFIVVDQMPEFPGGEEAKIIYLMDNLKITQLDTFMNIVSRVTVTFVIDTLGKVRDACIDDLYYRTHPTPVHLEVLRVVQMMPDWTPGRLRGKKVPVRFHMPVNIDWR